MKIMHHVATSREVLDYSQKKKKKWRERYWTDPFLDKDVKLLSVERKRKQEKIRPLTCTSSSYQNLTSILLFLQVLNNIQDNSL
jgi:hypothetical protein